MSRLRLDDDLFSPIQFDSSTIYSSDNSEGSENELFNANMTLSFTDTRKDKSSVGDNEKSSRKKSELRFKERKTETKNVPSESVSACTPISSGAESTSLITKHLSSDFLKLKIEKENNLKRTLKTENFECFKEKLSLPIENIDGCSTPKYDSSEQVNNQKKRSRPTTLVPLKDEYAKFNILKDIKKKQENTSTLLKNTCSENESHKSSTKTSSEKGSGNSSLHLKKKFDDLRVEDSPKSIKLNEKDSPVYARKDASKVENLELASSHARTEYKESIEKIVQDSIIFESGEIRQNIYMQQMSFYRQMNKMKNDMEQQHTAVTERMLGIIEELVQINASLKSRLANKS